MRAGQASVDEVVVDASVLVELLGDFTHGQAVQQRLRDTRLHAPAHLDAEVLSAMGRLHRAGTIDATDVEAGLNRLAQLPVQRHGLNGLLLGAWARRADVRLLDALYVELASQLRVPLLTVDRKLARVCGMAEDITA
ncbi:type II toxin-antitoxin system VapC family toxin [Mycobacterium shinjukuense]|uniref:Ribonuclease VapC n=1 Tax=Mycobacterium shinjukuense TaxID=398694 RepID=A0A7I7MSQ6_9MYCO|nr:type II toxin-antitoxin system VapC family toxin [Mycobacterium shinjukuense]ORB69877.1 VapC toxin family PIN domain ribonuclease [Mycobacterium shinjukuense]BBX74603.1 ribonuclease VapC3 [Mycobacterium shinjukuense]